MLFIDWLVCLFHIPNSAWYVQVCFGRQISQYHMENDRPVGAIIQLGNYNKEKVNRQRIFCISTSVPGPWHFGADPDPRIHASD